MPKKSPFRLLISIITTTRRCSSVLKRSKAPTFPCIRFSSVIAKELCESICRQGHDCSLHMLIVFFLPDTNPAGATVDRLLITKDHGKVVNDESNLIILDSLHRHAAVDIFCKAAEHPWAAGPLHASYHGSQQS